MESIFCNIIILIFSSNFVALVIIRCVNDIYFVQVLFPFWILFGLMLADLVLANKLVLYDLEKQAIGWTEYNCKYQCAFICL